MSSNWSQIMHKFQKKYKLSLALPSLVSRAHPHPTVVRRQSSGGGAAWGPRAACLVAAVAEEAGLGVAWGGGDIGSSLGCWSRTHGGRRFAGGRCER